MLDRLSATEREIFDLLVLEMSDALITSTLNLDTLEVCIHRDSIMEKLEARNALQLMHIAFLCGVPISIGPAGESPRRSAADSRHSGGSPQQRTGQPRYRFREERRKE